MTTETDDLGVIMEPEAEEGGCEEKFAMQEAEGPEESCEDTPARYLVPAFQYMLFYSSTIPIPLHIQFNSARTITKNR